MFKYKFDDITIYSTRSDFNIPANSNENIAYILSKRIIDSCEHNIIVDIIEKNYEGFYENEKKNIIKKLYPQLELSKESRRIYIEQQLAEYFRQEYLINIRGFIRFRLKDYRRLLEDMVDDAVEKYVSEREYFEFIGLIKEYIRLQKTGIDMLNIITKSDGSTVYFDRSGKELTQIFEEEYSFETDLSEYDKLLTILILSAPHKIIWHKWNNLKNDELLGTIREIFDDSVILCSGCSICDKNIEK